MKNGQYLGNITLESVDDSIVTHDDFSKGALADFRNNPTRAWVTFKPADGGDNQLGGEVGVFNGASRQVVPYGQDIIERLRRPDDSRHWSRRRLASL